MLLLLGLTGFTLIIVRGSVFHGLREWLSAKRPQDIGYLFTCSQCMGFWVGILAYAAVALCAHFTHEVACPLPIAALVATAQGFTQWALVLLLGGLIGLCAVLANHLIELMLYARIWLINEIETRYERRILARKVFEDPGILEEPGIFDDPEE